MKLFYKEKSFIGEIKKNIWKENLKQMNFYHPLMINIMKLKNRNLKIILEKKINLFFNFFFLKIHLFLGIVNRYHLLHLIHSSIKAST